MQVTKIVHAGAGQQFNVFGAAVMTTVTASASPEITQYQPSMPASSPSPPSSPVSSPDPQTPESTTAEPTLADIWQTQVRQDEVQAAVADCPWILPSSVVNAVVNAHLGHTVDLCTVARSTRDFVKVHGRQLPLSFRGLEYKGLRFGRRVSRRNTSSSNFPNQLSLVFEFGRSYVHIMLFDSGSVKMAGVRCLSDARHVLIDLARLPGVCTRCPMLHHSNTELHVAMYKRQYRLPFDEIKLEELAYALEDFSHAEWSATVEYGVTRSTAVKLYLRNKKQHAEKCQVAKRCARSCIVSMQINRTGSIMSTGRASAQLRAGMEVFCDFLAKHIDDVVENVAEDLLDADDSCTDEMN